MYIRILRFPTLIVCDSRRRLNASVGRGAASEKSAVGQFDRRGVGNVVVVLMPMLML